MMPRRTIASLALVLGLAASSAGLAQGLLPPGDMPRPPQKPQVPAGKPAPAGRAPLVAPPADGMAQRATVDRLTTYYNSIQSMTGTFEQTDPDGSRKTGNFYMQKPGRVRFEYADPSPIELIANGRDVAVRDRRLNTQDITPLSQTPLRFLLAERVDLANDPHVKGIFQDDHFITVSMEEMVPMVGTYRLLILFSAKDYALKQWIVTDPQGYDTQVALSNQKPNRPQDPQLFVINNERFLQ